MPRLPPRDFTAADRYHIFDAPARGHARRLFIFFRQGHHTHSADSQHHRPFSCLYVAAAPTSEASELSSQLSGDGTSNIARIDEDGYCLILQYFPGHFPDRQAIKHFTNKHRLSGVCEAFALLGFVRFLHDFHLYVVTHAEEIATVGVHPVYGVRTTKLILLNEDGRNQETMTRVGNRIEDMWSEEYRLKDAFLGVRPSAFFYSPSLDLSRTAQSNCLSWTSPSSSSSSGCPELATTTTTTTTTTTNAASATQQQQPAQQQVLHHQPRRKFHWNTSLCDKFERALPILAQQRILTRIIHGDVFQRRIVVAAHAFQFTVVTRRSRHFAGVRYLKRGITEEGRAANHVETEQIIIDETTDLRNPALCSFTQVRCSVPVLWYHDNVVAPKPPIYFGANDANFTSTRNHFAELIEDFGVPVIICNLMQQKERKPREEPLSDLFFRAVSTITADATNATNATNVTNATMKKPIQYHEYDFRNKVQMAWNLMTAFAERSLADTGCFMLRNGAVLSRQRGVVRTNCVDCIDRTNVAQCFIAVHVLEQQLVSLGGIERPVAAVTQQLRAMMLDLFQTLGDNIAQDYCGSETVSAGIDTGRGFLWDKAMGFKRFYANKFSDSERQMSMNFFLALYSLRFRPAVTGAPCRCVTPDDLIRIGVDAYYDATNICLACAPKQLQRIDDKVTAWDSVVSFFGGKPNKEEKFSGMALVRPAKLEEIDDDYYLHVKRMRKPPSTVVGGATRVVEPALSSSSSSSASPASPLSSSSPSSKKKSQQQQQQASSASDTAKATANTTTSRGSFAVWWTEPLNRFYRQNPGAEASDDDDNNHYDESDKQTTDQVKTTKEEGTAKVTGDNSEQQQGGSLWTPHVKPMLEVVLDAEQVNEAARVALQAETNCVTPKPHTVPLFVVLPEENAFACYGGFPEIFAHEQQGERDGSLFSATTSAGGGGGGGGSRSGSSRPHSPRNHSSHMINNQRSSLTTVGGLVQRRNSMTSPTPLLSSKRAVTNFASYNNNSYREQQQSSTRGGGGGGSRAQQLQRRSSMMMSGSGSPVTSSGPPAPTPSCFHSLTTLTQDPCLIMSDLPEFLRTLDKSVPFRNERAWQQTERVLELWDREHDPAMYLSTVSHLGPLSDVSCRRMLVNFLEWDSALFLSDKACDLVCNLVASLHPKFVLDLLMTAASEKKKKNNSNKNNNNMSKDHQPPVPPSSSSSNQHNHQHQHQQQQQHITSHTTKMSSVPMRKLMELPVPELEVLKTWARIVQRVAPPMSEQQASMMLRSIMMNAWEDDRELEASPALHQSDSVAIPTESLWQEPTPLRNHPLAFFMKNEPSSSHEFVANIRRWIGVAAAPAKPAGAAKNSGRLNSSTNSNNSSCGGIPRFHRTRYEFDPTAKKAQRIPPGTVLYGTFSLDEFVEWIAERREALQICLNRGFPSRSITEALVNNMTSSAGANQQQTDASNLASTTTGYAAAALDSTSYGSTRSGGAGGPSPVSPTTGATTTTGSSAYSSSSPQQQQSSSSSSSSSTFRPPRQQPLRPELLVARELAALWIHYGLVVPVFYGEADHSVVSTSWLLSDPQQLFTLECFDVSMNQRELVFDGDDDPTLITQLAENEPSISCPVWAFTSATKYLTNDVHNKIDEMSRLQRASLEFLGPLERCCVLVNVFNVLYAEITSHLSSSMKSWQACRLLRRHGFSFGGVYLSLADIKHGLFRDNQPQPGYILPQFAEDDTRMNLIPLFRGSCGGGGGGTMGAQADVAANTNAAAGADTRRNMRRGSSGAIRRDDSDVTAARDHHYGMDDDEGGVESSSATAAGGGFDVAGDVGGVAAAVLLGGGVCGVDPRWVLLLADILVDQAEADDDDAELTLLLNQQNNDDGAEDEDAESTFGQTAGAATQQQQPQQQSSAQSGSGRPTLGDILKSLWNQRDTSDGEAPIQCLPVHVDNAEELLRNQTEKVWQLLRKNFSRDARERGVQPSAEATRAMLHLISLPEFSGVDTWSHTRTYRQRLNTHQLQDNVINTLEDLVMASRS